MKVIVHLNEDGQTIGVWYKGESRYHSSVEILDRIAAHSAMAALNQTDWDGLAAYLSERPTSPIWWSVTEARTGEDLDDVLERLSTPVS